MIKVLNAIIFILLTLFLSCSNAGKTGSADQKNIQNPVVDWVILNQGTQCSVNEPSQVFIKSFEEFQNEWNRAFSGMGIKPEMPQVDFSKSCVVAAFMGMKNKGGFEVTVGSVQEVNDSLIVGIKHISPGPGCMSAMDIEYPYVFAKIPRLPEAKQVFRVKDEIKNCN